MGSSNTKSQTQQVYVPPRQQFMNPEVININVLIRKTGRVTKEYQFLTPPIGKGNQSEIRKAINRKTGILRTVKIIQQGSGREDGRVQNELKMLERLDHPCIIKINEYYSDERFHYIVSEYYAGGELFHRIEQQRQFTEEQAAKIMFQLLCAVHYCHLNHVIHRDIRPENIMFLQQGTDLQLVLIDFGACAEITGRIHSQLSHPFYTAPEVYSKKYDKQIDVWACGVLLYILICGYPPFRGKTDKQIKQNVMKGIVEFDDSEWDTVSQDVKDLITKMLIVDPTKRITTKQALNDLWFLRKWDIAPDDLQFKRVFQNMVTCRPTSRLQEATLSLIVLFLASREELSELRMIFLHIDTKHDGLIDCEELQTVMQRVVPSEEAREQSARLTQVPMGYFQFICKAIDRQALLTKSRIETAFKLIDRNGSGGIAIEELKEAFKIENEYYQNPWQEVMNEVDVNHDGNLSLHEFNSMIFKLSKY